MKINIEIERRVLKNTKYKQKKQRAVIYFPGSEVKWIPTYDQMINILHKMAQCEANNQDLNPMYGEQDG